MNQKYESWIKSKWRPALAWLYGTVILFDFILAPVFWTMIQVIASGTVEQQWMPISMGQGGMFHMSMGAIIGVTAWSRGREKVAGVAGDHYPQSMFQRERQYTNQQPYNDSEEI